MPPHEIPPYASEKMRDQLYRRLQDSLEHSPLRAEPAFDPTRAKLRAECLALALQHPIYPDRSALETAEVFYRFATGQPAPEKPLAVPPLEEPPDAG